MKLTRKPLATCVALLIFGLPPDIVWGSFDTKYSPESAHKHRDGGGSVEDAWRSKMALEVADVISDVKIINHRNAELKQRVLLLELKLAKTLQHYQKQMSERAAVKNSHVVRAASVDEAASVDKVRSADIKMRLKPAVLVFSPLQEPVELFVEQPHLAIAEEQVTTEPQAVVQSSKNDEGMARAAQPEREDEAVIDSTAASDEMVEPSVIGEELAMSDTTLGEMRGGFTTTSGLQITFGIERMLYVNGALVSVTSLNALNLGSVTPVTPVTPTAAEIVAGIPKVSTPTVTLPQTSASVADSNQSAAAGSSTSTAGSATSSGSTTGATSSSTSPVAAAGESSSASGTQVASVTNMPGSVALIQSGAGNSVSSGVFSASDVGTVVQNTLNNQRIQNVTVISATVNSMEILKLLNLQAAINNAVNDSVRK